LYWISLWVRWKKVQVKAGLTADTVVDADERDVIEHADGSCYQCN
jgi:hypothetical protein